MNKDIDRLDWLREIRRKIVEKCDSDPALMGDYYRKVQKQCEKRVITDLHDVNTLGESEQISA